MTVAEVAEASQVSSRQLARLFVGEFGITVQDYIHFIKVGKARELLKKTDVAISYIAESLGFSSSNYFATFFRKIEGISPHEFRRIYSSKKMEEMTSLYNILEDHGGNVRKHKF